MLSPCFDLNNEVFYETVTDMSK